MTRCKVCKRDKQGCCICGYCVDCLVRYGHEKCRKIEQRENVKARCYKKAKLNFNKKRKHEKSKMP